MSSAIIGFGAIGQAIARAFAQEPSSRRGGPTAT
jgi:predicted dinucleotide-binding enzyme